MTSQKHVTLITLLILLTGFLTSAGIALHNHDSDLKNTMELLRIKNTAISNLVEKHIDDYISIVHNVNAFFASSNEVSYAEWKEFIKQSEIVSRYQGALSIAFIKYIDPKNIDSEIATQKSIYGGFDVYPKDYKNQYCIVYYETRFGSPYYTRGLNRCANSITRDALFKSRTSGKPLFTNGVVKQTDNDNTDTILVFPIQQNGVFIGWVAISINLHDMFESMFHIFGNNFETDYEVFQLDINNNKEHLVYDYNDNMNQSENGLHYNEKAEYYANRHI